MKGANWLLAGVMTLLGFGGCEAGKTPPEYGVPSADFTVKGTVVNKAGGKPVKGIRVSYISPEDRAVIDDALLTEYDKRMTDITETDGSFSITGGMFPNTSIPVSLYTQDLDGTENGGYFGTDSLEVDFSEAQLGGKPDGWYNGEYTVTVEVGLTEKDADE
jgi:putative lipoprotein (rSAM/lipoprotein system)